MKTNDRKKTLIIILLIVDLVFIFGNSMLSIEKSKQVSNAVVTVIEKVTGIDFSDDEQQTETHGINYYVRKIAHMTEFAILGILCVLLFMYEEYSVTRFKSLVITGLSVPLIDEGIQFFSARGYELTDVYIDIIGFSIGAGIMMLIKRIKNKNSRKC